MNDTFRLGRVAGIPIGCSDASADSEPRAPKRRPEAWLGISRDPCRPPPPPAAGGSAGREAMRQPVGEPGLRFHLALRLFFRALIVPYSSGLMTTVSTTQGLSGQDRRPRHA